MMGNKPAARHWWAGPITGIARLLATWATITWAWEKLRNQIRSAGKDTRVEAERVARDARRLLAANDSKNVSALRSEVLQKAPASVQRFMDMSREGGMEKKKKSWSFFKVILVLGMIVAVAVFLLDRILPKPYRDEELEDDWNPQMDDAEENTPERPMAAEGVAEPEEEEETKTDVSGNGKLDEPAKKTTTRKKTTKKDDEA